MYGYYPYTTPGTDAIASVRRLQLFASTSKQTIEITINDGFTQLRIHCVASRKFRRFSSQLASWRKAVVPCLRSK